MRKAIIYLNRPETAFQLEAFQIEFETFFILNNELIKFVSNDKTIGILNLKRVNFIRFD